MNDRSRLFADLVAFVDDAVRLEGESTRTPVGISRKLDVLQRVVELLRLQDGVMENRLPMRDLLASGIEVSPWASGALRLSVGVGPTFDKDSGRPAPGGRTQGELQVPLIRYLLRGYWAPRRINDLLVEFLGEIRPWLSTDDVESTRTGVMRVMTTTRSAARSLRLHGLLTDSARTAHKTWELSVLGLLVGAILHERAGQTPEVASRTLPQVTSGPFGGDTFLAQPVAEVLGLLRDPREVSAALQRICVPDRDVFATFDQAVNIMVSFTSGLESQRDGRHPEPHERREVAQAMMEALRVAVPPAALGRDLATHFAFEELLG